VNGELFNERLSLAAFNKEMRQILLDCCGLNWSQISPAIFGALFQSVMNPQLRRNLGAHYTSEKNILKVIKPLFLDELRAEFEKLRTAGKKKLQAFQQKLARLKFLDPACGCGNFLVIAYRELRELELDVLRVLHKQTHTQFLDVGEFTVLLNVDQFYGIEIEEFPAQIARTALWLIDHQMNLKVSEEFGKYFVRLPLQKAAKIVHGNALRLDWRDIIQPIDLTYIMGNPPFVGKHLRTAEQTAFMKDVFTGVRNYKSLDYVAAWHRKAVDFMGNNPQIKTAFVSTNSITQGEQVAVLWQDLLQRGVKIHFAHRTFQWTNEARGKAAVHCVIIGFALIDCNLKRLFDYPNIKGEAIESQVNNISPYLVESNDIVITSRSKPLCHVSPMVLGNMPVDGGHLLLSPEEKVQLIEKEPQSEKWIKPVLGSEEFINNKERWCLWLVGISPKELRAMPLVLERVENVKKMRLASQKAATRKRAETPTLFGEIRHPKNSTYILVPRVSSERREYVPMGFFDSNTISSDANQTIPNATLYEFGILESRMHMAWMKTVTGRLKNDYRYSAKLVYNNFPFPQNPTEKDKQGIENLAQNILEIRAKYADSSLADLYDPTTMPPDLIKAHQKLDAAVDKIYAKKKFNSDAERVALLFQLYQQLISPLQIDKEEPLKKRRRRR